MEIRQLLRNSEVGNLKCSFNPQLYIFMPKNKLILDYKRFLELRKKCNTEHPTVQWHQYILYNWILEKCESLGMNPPFTIKVFVEIHTMVLDVLFSLTKEVVQFVQYLSQILIVLGHLLHND